MWLTRRGGLPEALVRRHKVRSPQVAEVAAHIATGAHTYLGRQFRTIGWATALLAVVIQVFVEWEETTISRGGPPCPPLRRL